LDESRESSKKRLDTQGLYKGENTMTTDRFDVNCEAYFNEKLHKWLQELSVPDLHTVLNLCFSVPTVGPTELPTIFPWNRSDPSLPSFGRFDQRIDFGKSLCVILELKVGTEATIGQLKKYLEYINAASYREGYVVLLSRNALAEEKLGYDMLKREHRGLLFVTWESLENSLKSLAVARRLGMSQSQLDSFIALLSFLTDKHKRSARLLDQPAPKLEDIAQLLGKLTPAAPPKKKDSILIWNSRLAFWNEVVETVSSQLGEKSWCAFRFDLYDWIIRWAHKEKKVFLDIYEDKNYEYYYHSFFTEVYPASKGLPSAQLSDLYYRILLIRDDREYLKTRNHRIFFHKQGKLVFFYAISDQWDGGAIPYEQLFTHRF
jgi:hypothetical protein